MKLPFVAIIVAAFIALAVGVPWLLGSAASQSNAENALRVQGFDQIHLVTRHKFLVELQGCGKEDVAKFDFVAQNARALAAGADLSTVPGGHARGVHRSIRRLVPDTAKARSRRTQTQGLALGLLL